MSFSKKHGYSSTPTIQFREDAPEGLRYAVVEAAYAHTSYSGIRSVICRTLYVAPDRNNWSDTPNIEEEVFSLILDAEWFDVYDIIENLVSFIENAYGYDAVVNFSESINDIFVGTGAGWQLVANKEIVMRGDSDFEDAVKISQSELTESGFIIAEKEIREALADLSRRPDADLTGAIHHALGAVEATARYIDGSNKDLGSIADKIGLPKPLDEALKKMWGFSSNFGRHVSLTNVPSANDAQLIVHLSSAYCRFLSNLHSK